MLFLFGSSPMKCEDQYQCEINSSVDYVEMSHEVKHLQSIISISYNTPRRDVSDL